MKATAAQKFIKNAGSNNLDTFNSMWNKNADSRIFQAINITNQIQDPVQQRQALDKIIPQDPATRKRFLEQYQNIKKMIGTGTY